MHTLEPFYNWRHLYTAEEDESSPFYGIVHSEFEFSNTIYNYYIHPQWEDFGSSTLYIKQLFTDYEDQYVILELIGEWNDAVENDFLILKRAVLELIMEKKISKFILIAENVLNFHSGDKDYYEEWQEEINEMEGWICLLNMPLQARYDFEKSHLDHIIKILEVPEWRAFQPEHLFQKLQQSFLYLS